MRQGRDVWRDAWIDEAMDEEVNVAGILILSSLEKEFLLENKQTKSFGHAAVIDAAAFPTVTKWLV